MDSKSVVQRRKWAINRILNSSVNQYRDTRFMKKFMDLNVVTDNRRIFYLKGDYFDYIKTDDNNRKIDGILSDLNKIHLERIFELQINADIVKTAILEKDECIKIEGNLFNPKFIKDTLDIMGKEAWFTLGKMKSTDTYSHLVCKNEIGYSLCLSMRGYGNHPETKDALKTIRPIERCADGRTKISFIHLR